MAASAEACGVMIPGGYGAGKRRSSSGGFTLLPATTIRHHRGFPSFSCKARGKNVSSQRRKQNEKLVLPRKLPLTAKNMPNGSEHAEAQNPSQNQGQTTVLDEASKSQHTEVQIVEQNHHIQTAVLDEAYRSHGQTLANEDVVASAILVSDVLDEPKTNKGTQPKAAYSNILIQEETAKIDKAIVAKANDNYQAKTQETDYYDNGQADNVNGNGKLQLCETKTVDFIPAEIVSDSSHISSIRLESLIEMIKNAEKNILLLNDARVLALKDLDKIVAEKEEMQDQIHMLEMKLARTEAQIKVVSQEKAHIEFLENELEKMKKEISSNEIEGAKHLNGSRLLNTEVLTFDMTSVQSLGAELDALRKENMSLKDDIQLLKDKLANVKESEKHLLSLDRERSLLLSSVKELESKLEAAQEDVSRLYALKPECKALEIKVENMQALLDNATKQADQAVKVSEKNDELQRKIKKLETQLNEINVEKVSSEKTQQYNELLQQKIKILEDHIQISDIEINSHIQLYEASVKEFQDTLQNLKEEKEKRSFKEAADDMPWEFWSRLLLIVESYLLENKISASDAKLLREMVWNKDVRLHDAYFSCNGKTDSEMVAAFNKLTSSRKSSVLNIVHIAAEMAPVAKVGGLGDVVTGLSKALQKRGHLVEIILPKYDCIQSDLVSDLKMLNTSIPSYFDGQLYKNNIWVGTVEGLPVYFIEPTHPAKFFSRGGFYGQHDDFKRFSFFSRAALELLYQAGKRPDIIHCHDWHTAFIAPLYWEVYAAKGLDSARICFTCHNFEYQGVAPASELASSGLDVQYLHKPDRMQDNLSPDRINLLKGAVVFSNIVTTVSPTYAEEVRTPEGGRGLHETLKIHSKKFTGILNGIDSEAWNPSIDPYLRFQYNVDDLNGKAENKKVLRKHLKLSVASSLQPLVGCITRLVPQKGVHLIRHAIYRTLELGGQFVLLGSSPVPHIQREFEDIANHFQNHPDARLVLKYDDALSHLIYAAADMLVIPSIFEPCGLTQMIAMRYGSVPIVRRTGGLNDSVFDVDDDTIPARFQNGFTFMSADEQGLGNAMERAFKFYTKNPQKWQQLVQKNMRIDFSWDTSSAQYEELYEKAATRARAATNAAV